MNNSKLACGRFYKNIFLKQRDELLKCRSITAEQAEAAAKSIALSEFRSDDKWATLIDEENKRLHPERYEEFEKGWFFITLRPSNDMNLQDFKTLTNEMLKRKFWIDGFLVWEQRGTSVETMGYGFHTHSILRVSTPSKGISFFINEIVKIVKKLNLDEVIASNCIDFKKINTQADMKRFQNYINTVEFGKPEHKKPAWEYNKSWRESKGIQDEYTINSRKKNNNIISLMNSATLHN